MRRFTRRLLAPALGLGALLSACSPPAMLNALNRLTPGDGNAHRVGEGIAYGDAERQRLDIWAPKQAQAGALPVVIFFYGGAWVKGARGDYGFAGRAFAAKGFVAVVPDYRLVPDVRFPAFVEDSARAVKWVHDNIARFGGDPGRIALAGHSAGAYNAAMVALDGHYLRDLGVDPHVVRAAALLAGPYDFYPWDDQRAVDAMANWPRPAETQPVTFVSGDAPPLFIAYGSADETVKPRNSRRLAAAMAAAGAPYVLKEYAGKSHVDLVMGLSKPFRGKASTLADSAAFLRAHDGARSSAAAPRSSRRSGAAVPRVSVRSGAAAPRMSMRSGAAAPRGVARPGAPAHMAGHEQ